MGDFSNNAVTNAGRVLLSHVQMGAVFTPTKIVMGSGSLSGGQTVSTMTAVIQPVKTLQVVKKQRGNDGTAVFGGVYSNQDVTSAFYFRELALYAKAVYSDGRQVDEVLYSYGNSGSTADLMPAYTSGQPVERQIDLVTYVGNNTEVNLTIEGGVSVTYEQVVNMINVAMQEGAGGLVIIPTGSDIPAEERKEGFLYFRQSSGVTLRATPTMQLKFDD